MTDRNTAATAHGEVEYETVTCDSCESEVLKSEAKRFVIGDYVRTYTWTDKADELQFRNYTKGWACEYCRTEGPASYPQWSACAWFAGLSLPSVVLLLGAIVLSLMAIVTVVFGP